MKALLRRLRLDLYIVAIMAMAALLPARGAGKDALDLVVHAAIALLFFIYGAKISPQAIWAGVTHWRLQGLVFLPLMLFHQMQLMVCAVLARRYSLRPEEPAPTGAARRDACPARHSHERLERYRRNRGSLADLLRRLSSAREEVHVGHDLDHIARLVLWGRRQGLGALEHGQRLPVEHGAAGSADDRR